MNRENLKQTALDAATRCLAKKGFIALVDVFLEMENSPVPTTRTGVLAARPILKE